MRGTELQWYGGVAGFQVARLLHVRDAGLFCGLCGRPSAAARGARCLLRPHQRQRLPKASLAGDRLKPEATKMRRRIESAALRVYAVLTILVLFHSPAHAADYAVKRDGTGD